MCIATKPPQGPSRTTTRTLPYTFNSNMVCVDLMYLVDAEDNRYVALPVVCAGTVYHVACLVRSRVPKYVMQVFVEMLLTRYAVSVTVVVDEGCEFESTFAHECKKLTVRIAESHSGWQQRLVEGRGGLLSEMWNNIVYEFHVSGREQAKLALAMWSQERNMDERGVVSLQSRPCPDEHFDGSVSLSWISS